MLDPIFENRHWRNKSVSGLEQIEMLSSIEFNIYFGHGPMNES